MLAHFLCFLVVIVQLGSSSPVYFNKRLQEAEQIALESSGLLLPLDVVVDRIMRDLKAIRTEYPIVDGITIARKWIPGEVAIQKITDEQISQIDESRLFAPLTEVRKLRGAAVLVFSKPYNPERLAERLYDKFGLRAEPQVNAEENFLATGSIRYNPSDSTLTFEKKPLSNFSAFRTKAIWEFRVQNGRVKLIGQTKPGFAFSSS